MRKPSFVADQSISSPGWMPERSANALGIVTCSLLVTFAMSLL